MSFLGKRLYAHRVVWALAHGSDPYPFVVDHIDGDPSNNRVGNLRAITQHGNLRNASASSSRKTSRYKGVSLIRSTGKWRASMYLDGRCLHIGVFNDERDAALLYNATAALFFHNCARVNVLDSPGKTVPAFTDGEPAKGCFS